MKQRWPKKSTKQSDSYTEISKLPSFIPKPKKKLSKSTPKVKIKERDIQQMAEDLCDSLGIRFFRIPDKLMGFLANFAPVWVRVFVSRYLRGVPDLMLFKRLETGDNIVRFIEIKTEAGKVSQGQTNWHMGLNVKVCYGWEETKKEIESFNKK